MFHPVRTYLHRHPAVTRRLLTLAQLYSLLLPAATTAVAATGHRTLTVVGVSAMIGLYGAGYAAAWWRARAQVAAARLDPLTGLPHRAVAEEILADATRTGTPMTVALIDVDGLHMVNTSLGHAAGDQYLTVIAERLTRAVPPGGVLVRQGGDEFTLLAPGNDPQTMVVDIGAALAGPAVIGGRRLQPRASVGVAATSAADPDAGRARARADVALYTAKRDGGNQSRVFDPDRDPTPDADGTRPVLRRRDINPLAADGVAWQPAPGDDLIPLLLSRADTRAVHAAVLLAAGHRRQTGTPTGWPRHTVRAGVTDPDRISVGATPTADRHDDPAVGGRQARYTRLAAWLAPLLDTDAGGRPAGPGNDPG